jgi:hypothetical protein
VYGFDSMILGHLTARQPFYDEERTILDFQYGIWKGQGILGPILLLVLFCCLDSLTVCRLFLLFLRGAQWKLASMRGVVLFSVLGRRICF